MQQRLSTTEIAGRRGNCVCGVSSGCITFLMENHSLLPHATPPLSSLPHLTPPHPHSPYTLWLQFDVSQVRSAGRFGLFSPQPPMLTPDNSLNQSSVLSILYLNSQICPLLPTSIVATLSWAFAQQIFIECSSPFRYRVYTALANKTDVVPTPRG